MSEEIFVLILKDDHIRGIFSSLELLRDGANEWIKDCPHQTLAYEVWRLDHYSEPMRWGWVYITPEEFGDIGGLIPHEKFWGLNLLELNPKVITYKDK